MLLPSEFKTSYEAFESYPTQLIYKSSYISALESSKSRLAEAAPTLLAENDTEINVIFRDLDPTYQLPQKQNVVSDALLKEWLGDQSTIDPTTSALGGEIATKKDPICRFIYFWAGEHSRKALKLSRKSLTRIATYHQIMPAYLEFMFVFGQQDRPRDLRFSGFREQTLLGRHPNAPVIPSLGRSGQQFQLCYNLKASAQKNDSIPPWSIRQAAIHHQFDVVEGTSLWVITKGDRELKDRIEKMTGPHGRPEDRNLSSREECFKSSLAVHLLLSHWASEEWRWYIQWLEDIVDQKTLKAVDAPHGKDGTRERYEPKHVQAVQGYEDRINEAVMIMDANIYVETALQRYYEGLLRHKDFPLKRSCRDDILTFAKQINDMIYDTKMQVSRAKLLGKIASDRKLIIVKHLEIQATEIMEILTKSMHEISFQSQKEAIGMRVITVVTLLYLPATFVSTFFSTDVVTYQNQNNNISSTAGETGNNSTSFSSLALERWLEVTLPLTIITGLFAWLYFKTAIKGLRAMIGKSASATLPNFYKSEG